MTNPLGSAKRKHKIIGVYFTLADFELFYRSGIDNLQLLLLCNESDNKYSTLGMTSSMSCKRAEQCLDFYPLLYVGLGSFHIVISHSIVEDQKVKDQLGLHVLLVNLGIVETVDDALASYIRSVLPSITSQQSLVVTLKDLGVETLEDLKYVQEADLSDILRPAEARKLISRFNGIHTYC